MKNTALGALPQAPQSHENDNALGHEEPTGSIAPTVDGEIAATIKSVAKPAERCSSPASISRPAPVVTRTAQQLMNTVFPQQRWIIPDVLPEGLTLLAGSPKAGKSWMMLDLLLATAMGGMALGSFSATAGEAVYLALEDSFRRLQDRLRLLLDGEAPAGLHLITEWQRLDQGGVEALDQWLSEHPHVRLVVIDTLQKVRPPQKANANVYAEDYSSVAGLKALAERHNVAIVLVHHLRKAKGRDPLERVSGSTGLTGVVDAVWIMERQRGSQTAKLFVTGRDVVEQELQLTWDEDTARWTASCGAIADSW